MTSSKRWTALAAAAVIGWLTATGASAQATRTWVSGVGDDANPCSRTAPCKTFAGAISKTAAGGIIDAIDPGGYGAVTITKSVTIRLFGAGGNILAAGSNGINVNVPDGAVYLIGLSIDGVGTGLVGVNVINATQVTLIDCKITNFRTAGVRVASQERTRVTIKDSLIAGSAVGLSVEPPRNRTQSLFLDNAFLDANPTNILANQPSLVALRRTTVAGGLVTINAGAALRSYGDNVISGGTPTEVVPLN